MSRRLFSLKQELEICTKYEAGASSPVLAKEHGTSHQIILRVLRRNGVVSRSCVHQHRLSLAQELEVVTKYGKGLSAPVLSLEYGVSSSTIRNIVLRHGGIMRSIREDHWVFSKEKELEIGIKYAGGMSAPVLALEYGISPNTVLRIVRRSGYSVRPLGEAFRPEEIRHRMSESKRGEKNSNWRGGLSFEPYTLEFTKELKRSIRERDNYICQLCGAKQYDKAFSVHHIDYNKKNCKRGNLVTLCRGCHTKTNFDREFWIGLFNAG